jgi:hypothetical protein
VSVARMTWWLVGLRWVSLFTGKAVWCAVSRAEFGGKRRLWVPVMPVSCRLFAYGFFFGRGRAWIL